MTTTSQFYNYLPLCTNRGLCCCEPLQAFCAMDFFLQRKDHFGRMAKISKQFPPSYRLRYSVFRLFYATCIEIHQKHSSVPLSDERKEKNGKNYETVKQNCISKSNPNAQCHLFYEMSHCIVCKVTPFYEIYHVFDRTK